MIPICSSGEVNNYIVRSFRDLIVVNNTATVLKYKKQNQQANNGSI